MDEDDMRKLKRLQLKMLDLKKDQPENEKPYNVLSERVMLDGSKHPITKIYRNTIVN